MVTAVVAVLKFSDNFLHFFAPHVRPRKSRKLFRSGFYDVDEIIGPRPEPWSDPASGFGLIYDNVRIRIEKLDPNVFDESEIFRAFENRLHSERDLKMKYLGHVQACVFGALKRAF